MEKKLYKGSRSTGRNTNSNEIFIHAIDRLLIYWRFLKAVGCFCLGFRFEKDDEEGLFTSDIFWLRWCDLFSPKRHLKPSVFKPLLNHYWWCMSSAFYSISTPLLYQTDNAWHTMFIWTSIPVRPIQPPLNRCPTTRLAFSPHQRRVVERSPDYAGVVRVGWCHVEASVATRYVGHVVTFAHVVDEGVVT